jgi:hypothetical protein
MSKTSRENKKKAAKQQSGQINQNHNTKKESLGKNTNQTM